MVFRLCSLVFFAAIFSACEKDPPDQTVHEQREDLVLFDTAKALNEAKLLFLKAEQFLKHAQSDSSLYYHLLALDLRTKAGIKNQDLAESYYQVGGWYERVFKYDIADTYIEKARLLADELTNVDPKLLLEIYFRATSCKSNLKDYVSSFSLIKKAHGLVLQHFTDDKELLSRINFLYSLHDRNVGNYARAIEFMKKAISLIDGNWRWLGHYYNSLG